MTDGNCGHGQAEIPPLQRAFEMIDTDKDGQITLQEFIDFAKSKHKNLAPETIDRVAGEKFKEVDTHGSGKTDLAGFKQLRDAVHALL